MSVESDTFTTAELSIDTWPDYETFFGQIGSGWCGCMLFPRGCHLPANVGDRAHVQARNLAEKRHLVEQGRAHGILVYVGGDPIGWCQYGPVAELPVDDMPRPARRQIQRAVDPTSQWRITSTADEVWHRRR